MTIELIRADELRLVAGGPGKQGRIGVVYQVAPTGELYRWDGSKHSPVSGDGSDSRRRVLSMLGAVAIDLPTVSTLPAGATHSGSGSYANAGRLSTQNTGAVKHAVSGWYDGTACLEWTPSTDSEAEIRCYVPSGLNISDDDGIAFEFEIPEVDASKTNFTIAFDFANTASDLFPVNTGFVRVWRCAIASPTPNQSKEKAGRKYIRQRWDSTVATDAAMGAWPLVTNVGTAGGTGADRRATVRWFRFRASNFAGKTIKLKCVRRGGRSTPAFTIGSDSANPEMLFSSMAYAVSKGLRPYLAQYLDVLTGDRLDAYRRAAAAGVEITGDDITDRPLGTITDEATMRAAIEGTRDGLRALGLGDSKFWVANNNSTSYLMIRELQRAGYVANRNGTTDGLYTFPEGGVPDAFRMPSWGCDNQNFADIKPKIDRAVQYGCTLHLYWHVVLSAARMDDDRAANVTGVAGAPIARNAGESMQAYRARVGALGTPEGNASATYFDARIGVNYTAGIWWEELKQLLDYLATLNADGTAAVVSPDQWCRDVGLMPR